jgi:uncharacterized protein YprB with RNaseH-like and TPR domain
VEEWGHLMYEAFLDIETTGLSPLYSEITVIGACIVRNRSKRMIQLIGEEVTAENLHDVLDGVHTIYTYNGSRFDLPFIRERLGVDLNDTHNHCDLMYDCWRNNLYGGLKMVELQLDIPRQLKDIDGYQAVLLWWRYRNHGDKKALKLLLHYNREDVMNLTVLKEKLKVR